MDQIPSKAPEHYPDRPELVGDHRGSSPAAPEAGSNASAPPLQESISRSVETMKDVLGKFGKKVSETTRKTETMAGSFWQHLKTGPSMADAAMGRIAHTTKVISEGGYEKIFRQNFETLAGEELRNSFICYLSTSAGPVMGVLYLSTMKVAFCSDNPMSYKSGDKTEWSYYKVILPLSQLRSVAASTSRANQSEKYIQLVSVDNHEFWFMGFVNYDAAVSELQAAASGATPEAH